MVTTPAGVELQSFEDSPASGAYLARYDSNATSASMAVIATLSMVMDRCPTELAPLQSAVDTDALDAIFRESDTSGSGVSVTFSVPKHTVTVGSSGTVTVTKPEAQVSAETNGRPTQ
ncbi:hypothetical protein HWV23_15700 [Natronomonas halophila]|uniref:HalOD1 output domain-containing protein n=1 Tax=Natronomonas halophila TaxID=2747817 RepID=UPI0015B3AC70|nr:HalOD1 output domain-containing protein [Natronomonas halophila]QLD87106.1 hypothetical protein HWV23_15700 [Natronomonas halophila]